MNNKITFNNDISTTVENINNECFDLTTLISQPKVNKLESCIYCNHSKDTILFNLLIVPLFSKGVFELFLSLYEEYNDKNNLNNIDQYNIIYTVYLLDKIINFIYKIQILKIILNYLVSENIFREIIYFINLN